MLLFTKRETILDTRDKQEWEEKTAALAAAGIRLNAWETEPAPVGG